MNFSDEEVFAVFFHNMPSLFQLSLPTIHEDLKSSCTYDFDLLEDSAVLVPQQHVSLSLKYPTTRTRRLVPSDWLRVDGDDLEEVDDIERDYLLRRRIKREMMKARARKYSQSINQKNSRVPSASSKSTTITPAADRLLPSISNSKNNVSKNNVSKSVSKRKSKPSNFFVIFSKLCVLRCCDQS